MFLRLRLLCITKSVEVLIELQRKVLVCLFKFSTNLSFAVSYIVSELFARDEALR